MRSDKFKAYKLRINGRSYNEISRLLKVPKSTLSAWFSTLELPEEAAARLRERVHAASLRGLLARNKNQTLLAESRAKISRQNGEDLIKNLSKRELLLIGASLYWAEGYKRPIMKNGKPVTSHRVSLTNSDPNLVYIFLRFLREVCEVPDEKIKIWVRTFENQDTGYILDFWQKKCKIPYSNFHKTLQTKSISSQGKRPFNSLPFGVVQISVGNTELYHKIMGLISGITNS